MIFILLFEKINKIMNKELMINENLFILEYNFYIYFKLIDNGIWIGCDRIIYIKMLLYFLFLVYLVYNYIK